MFRFIKKFKKRWKEKQEQQQRDAEATQMYYINLLLIRAELNFFHNEAMNAYSRWEVACANGDEEAAEVAKYQYFVAYRRYLQTRVNGLKMITNKKNEDSSNIQDPRCGL